MPPQHAQERTQQLQGAESRTMHIMKTLDISRTITDFILFYLMFLKVCLKINTDLVKTVKQSNLKDVPKWRHDKNRCDLGTRR